MERFVADRLYRQDDGVRGGTRPAIIIATIGIAIGLFVMIVSISITRGFRSEIRGKVAGFSQDIVVSNYYSNISDEEQPLNCTPYMMEELLRNDNIRNVQRYIEQAAILRTDSAFQGFVLKGVGPEYDFSFFESCLTEGTMPVCSDTLSSGELLLSRTLADKLEVGTGDRIDVYFMQDRIRMRRMTVCGIYQTNFSEYDGMYGLTDIHTLRQLRGWSAVQAAGLEISVTDADNVYDSYLDVRGILDKVSSDTGDAYLVRTSEQINAGLFAWLDVLNVNVWIILILMLGIAGFTMISGLLIIIFERTRTIGILKALGSSDTSVRRIFIYLSMRIIGRGLIVGNLLGVTLCLLQKKYHIIPLDPANYYLDSVPCDISLSWIIVLNLVMFSVSLLMLVGPTAVISKISPSKSIRFE